MSTECVRNIINRAVVHAFLVLSSRLRVIQGTFEALQVYGPSPAARLPLFLPYFIVNSLAFTRYVFALFS
ncbi:hypothetical protein BDZ97DRAFT_1825220 [Flammula alnicola]|nr:hypothetical protein BDZ97DRAFT_1825220 [Flammula alnicola]